MRRILPPFLSPQAFHLYEMLIAADQDQVILQGRRRNPDVIFRNRMPLLPQAVLDLAVQPGGFSIAGKNHIIDGKLFNPSAIFFRPA